MTCRALLIPTLCLIFSSCKDEKSTSPTSPAQLPELSVSIGQPQREDIPVMREWIGQLHSIAESPIIPQVSGYIQSRLFTNGQEVKKDQILYQIDKQIYQQAYQQTQQKVASLQAQYKKSQQDANYYKPLVKSGSISRQSYTDALQIERSLKASLSSAQAEAAQAQTKLGYCTLRAPMDGTVGFAKAFVGNYVSPSSPPLVLVNSLNPIRIYFNISEQDWLRQDGPAGSLRPGSSVNIILADGSSYHQRATISGIDNRVQSNTGSIMIDANLPNPDLILRPGMYVSVRAQVQVLQNALTVPLAALAYVQGKTLVLTYDKSTGAVHIIPVILGEQYKDRVVISHAAGKLDEHSIIITKGSDQGLMASMKRARLRISPSAEPAN